jgi:AcrR family transcriptional regulator
MQSKAAESRPHPGRPREHRLDDAILNAALEVFLEKGYQAATFSEIGRRAGTGTPPMYRRWPDKAALAIDVLGRSLADESIPETASIEADLVEFVRSRIRSWRTPLFHRLMVPLMSEGTNKSLVERRIAARYIADMEPLLARLELSIEAGELRSVDPQLVLDLLGGPIVVRLLFNQELPAESDAEPMVRLLFDGLAARGSPARQSPRKARTKELRAGLSLARPAGAGQT